MAKHEEEQEEGGAWEIALADLMTVLMVFFLVMWLVSIVDPADRQAFIEGIEGSPGASGDASTEEVTDDSAKAGSPINPLDLKPPIGTEQVEEALSTVNPKDIDIEETEDFIKITLRSDSFFESGRATLNDKTLEQLEKLGESLAGRQQKVRITGYTDSIPISNLQFPSNWELSAARAATVARTFIYMDLEKEYITIEGKADNDPVAANDNAYGRSLNRRVLIVVSKNQGLEDKAEKAASSATQPATRQGATRNSVNNGRQSTNGYTRYQQSPQNRQARQSQYQQQRRQQQQPRSNYYQPQR